MVKLDRSALADLGPQVLVPTYDPAQLTTGIVHFGVGGFHRSHEAMYLDRLLNADPAGLDRHHDWAICGVGVLPGDAKMRDVFADQDNLYTLLTKSPANGSPASESSPQGQDEARIVGAVHRFLFAPDDPEAVLAQLADPATRIASLTVTEGGYSVSNATGEFDASGADIQHDLTTDEAPRTVFGFLTEGLRRRRDAGVPPFTVMSCDNMQGNGHVAQHALTSFARLKDPQLGEWIAEHVTFPNSMVDRITPVTTTATRQEIASTYGVEDEWPVLAESFTQWVLEDKFTLGRPALETVGVQLVQDVEPYELMKLRLLNASHQAMGCLGLLAGYTYVHEVCGEPPFVRFLLGYMAQEAAPTLRPVPGIDLGAYQHQLIERFSSVAIQDTLARLIVDASERIPKFLLPVVREQLAAEPASGGETDHAALVVAAWSCYLEAADRGEFPAVADVRAAQLLQAVRRETDEPGAFLNLTEVFGDLGQNERFRSGYLAAREHLRLRGPLGALEALAPQNVGAS